MVFLYQNVPICKLLQRPQARVQLRKLTHTEHPDSDTFHTFQASKQYSNVYNNHLAVVSFL